jgi:hypothetical protein
LFTPFISRKPATSEALESGYFQDEEKDGRALTCCAAEQHLQYRVFSKVPLWLPPILLGKNLFRQSVVFLAIIFHRHSSSAACLHTPLEEFALSISNTGMSLLHAPPRCAVTIVAVVMVMAEL